MVLYTLVRGYILILCMSGTGGGVWWGGGGVVEGGGGWKSGLKLSIILLIIY